MRRLPASQARERFSELLNEVAHGNKRTLLQRHGKDVAAVISAEDFRRFQELERRARKLQVSPSSRKPANPARKRSAPQSRQET
jgi:prevent-host-death family protein